MTGALQSAWDSVDSSFGETAVGSAVTTCPVEAPPKESDIPAECSFLKKDHLVSGTEEQFSRNRKPAEVKKPGTAVKHTFPGDRLRRTPPSMSPPSMGSLSRSSCQWLRQRKPVLSCQVSTKWRRDLEPSRPNSWEPSRRWKSARIGIPVMRTGKRHMARRDLDPQPSEGMAGSPCSPHHLRWAKPASTRT